MMKSTAASWGQLASGSTCAVWQCEKLSPVFHHSGGTLWLSSLID